ncbi:hypothetical protein Dimus_001212 [Dionaea muscipula]
MVEEENAKLKADLEKEKEKVKGIRERNVILHNELYDKTLMNKRLHSELNETYQKITKDYENQLLTVMDIKEELYESQLRLSEADGTIESLRYEIKDLEGRWKARSEFLERELEKIRAIMLSYSLFEDTSTSSSNKKIEDLSPIIVEDLMTVIIVYEPPPTFDGESVGEIEMSSPESVFPQDRDYMLEDSDFLFDD